MIQGRTFVAVIIAFLAVTIFTAVCIFADEGPSNPAMSNMEGTGSAQPEAESSELNAVQIETVHTLANEFLRQKKLEKLSEMGERKSCPIAD